MCLHIFKSNESATRFLGHETTLFRPSVITMYRDVLEELENGIDLVLVAHLLNQVTDLENRWKGGGLDAEKSGEIEGMVVKMA